VGMSKTPVVFHLDMVLRSFVANKRRLWGILYGVIVPNESLDSKSKCFYYPEGTNFEEFVEDEEDEINTVGCTNLDRDIYEGCIKEE
jgi:hypothetical protein